MKINLTLIYILLPLLYLAIPFCVLWLIKNVKLRNILTIVLLVIFSIGLCVGVLGNFYINNGNFYVYFNFTYEHAKVVDFNMLDNTIRDSLINILMLIPIGMAIVGLNLNSKKRMLILLCTVGFVLGATIETLQYVLPVARAVQISDVLLNGISVLIGGGIGCCYALILKKFKTN